MKIRLIICLLAIFFSWTLYAQRAGNLILITPIGEQHAFTKCGIASWAAGGTGVVDDGSNGAQLNNPACMEFTTFSASFEGSHRFKTKSYFSFEYDDLTSVPSVVTVGAHLGNFNLSLGYLRFLDYKIQTEIFETTPIEPEGTGRTFTIGSTAINNTYFGSANLSTGIFKFGITAGINHLSHENNFYGTEKPVTGTGTLFAFGVLVTPDEHYSLGASVKYASTIESNISVNGESFIAQARSPFCIDAGWRATINSWLSVLSSIEYQHWTDVGTSMQNVVNIHFGSLVDVSERHQFRFGFFTQTDPNTNYGDHLNQNFLTAGMNTTFPSFVFSLSVFDSHLFHTENDFHQTIVSFGVTYSLE